MEDAEFQARLLRLRAAGAEMQAATFRMAAAALEASAGLRALNAAMQEGFDNDLAEHPDMAELNVMLDGYYAEGSS